MLHAIVRDLYIDDSKMVTQTEQEMEALMDTLPCSCKTFGLTISLDKTLFRPALGLPYIESSIFVDGQKIQIRSEHYKQTRFTLDDEMPTRVKNATDAFAVLKDRVWSQRELKKCIKMTVYDAYVLMRVLYT